MKLHTKWKRIKGLNIIGIRFFDMGDYDLGFFTITKAYRCKRYSKHAALPNGGHWVDQRMVVVKTDAGIVYKVPFFPWFKACDNNNKSLASYYDEQPW